MHNKTHFEIWEIKYGFKQSVNTNLGDIRNILCFILKSELDLWIVHPIVL